MTYIAGKIKDDIQMEQTFCLGNCALGPSAMVNGKPIGRATCSKIFAAADGGDFMIKVFVPLDSAALSVGAEEVAIEIAMQAANSKVDIQIIRTGSRGMLWLEPLVEVETASGRVGFANISVESEFQI